MEEEKKFDESMKDYRHRYSYALLVCFLFVKARPKSHINILKMPEGQVMLLIHIPAIVFAELFYLNVKQKTKLTLPRSFMNSRMPSSSF